MTRKTKRWLGCLAVVALLVAGHLVISRVGDFPPRPIVVAGSPSDMTPIHSQSYFGFDSSNAVPRHIAMVKGTFTLGTWVSVGLHSVRTGHVETVMGSTVGRSPNRYPLYRWSHMRIIVALGEEKCEGYTLTSLGCIGMSRGSGGGCEPLSNSTELVHSQLFTGPLPPQSEYLLYVEGDRPFEVTRETTLTELAQQLDGNYTVVTVKRN